MEDLLYVIPANSEKKDIVAMLEAHPEIKFVSLVGILLMLLLMHQLLVCQLI